VGVFWMFDEQGPDAKVLCVPATDPRWTEVADIPDLPPFLLAEIAHFFDVYKELEPGKGTETRGWEGAEAAERTVEEARRRYGT
jgi:inorganic pyrophosphatase